MSGVTELTDDSFKDFVSSNNRVVVDFWAPWCGPCLKMSPIFEELSGEMDGLAFAKVNVDEAQNVAREYGIRAIPAILVFSGGGKVGEITGFRPKEKLEEKLSEYF